MSFYVWVEIVCRKCAYVTAGRFTTGTIQRKLMRAEAERQGWTFHDMGEEYGRDWECNRCRHG